MRPLASDRAWECLAPDVPPAPRARAARRDSRPTRTAMPVARRRHWRRRPRRKRMTPTLLNLPCSRAWLHAACMWLLPRVAPLRRPRGAGTLASAQPPSAAGLANPRSAGDRLIPHSLPCGASSTNHCTDYVHTPSSPRSELVTQPNRVTAAVRQGRQRADRHPRAPGRTTGLRSSAGTDRHHSQGLWTASVLPHICIVCVSLTTDLGSPPGHNGVVLLRFEDHPAGSTGGTLHREGRLRRQGRRLGATDGADRGAARSGRAWCPCWRQRLD